MKQIYHFTRTAGKQQSLKAGVALLLMGVMLTLLPAALQAQVLKQFTQRTSNYSPDMPIYHIKGDYTMIGNTNVTFSNATLAGSTSNNSSIMKYVDVDENTFPTINSSTAALTFSDEFGANPACSEVLYAGLYWTGRDNDNTMERTITGAVYSTSTPTTLYSGGEIGVYRLAITSNGDNRIFTFTNGSNTVVLTMSRNSTNFNGLYIYTVDINGYSSTAISEYHLAKFITNGWNAKDNSIPLNDNYNITGLYWNSTLDSCYATVREVVTPPYIVSRNRIKIKHDNAPEYTEMEATLDNIYYSGQNGMTDYQDFYAAYVEVTDYVRQYGLGNYTVADLETHVGSGDNTGWIGGWCMVVVYENSKMKWRDITLFDGFARVANETNAHTVNIPISGFKTVQVGDINMKLGMMAAEGDAGISNDGCKIEIQNTGGFSPLTHNGSTGEGAFFNSSIQTGGNNRNPNYVNNTGIDIITLNINSDPNDPNAILYNEQTSTRFQFTTTRDLYFPFCFVMGVDAYIPEAEALSGVMNIDEDDITIDSETGNYLIAPGKEITFAVEVKNFGTEDIVDAKLEIPLPSTIEYYYTEVEYVHPGINIEGYYDAERYANGVAGWNIDYIPSGDPNQVYARVLLTVKVTEDCYVLASTDPECELAIEVNGTLEGTSYVNRVYFKKESFISGFADETGCQGNAIRNDIKVVVDKASYVNDNCQGRDYTVRLVNVCGNAFNAANPIPFMDIYALYPQGSRFFNAATGVEYTAATGFPISLAGNNASSAALIHVQPTSIYSAACTSDLRFILDPDGYSFTAPTLTNSATYCLGAQADSLSKHITSTRPSGIYYRFYKERSNSAVAYVDIVPPTDVEGTDTFYVRQFRENAIGCEDDSLYGPITIKVVSPITFRSSKVSPSCIGDTVIITGIPGGGTWSYDSTLTGITVSDSVLTIYGTSAGTYTVTYKHTNPGSAGYSCTNTERSYTHQIAATTNPGRLEANQTICQGAQIQPLQIVNHNGHVERWEWTTNQNNENWDTIPNNTSSISSADLGELAAGTYYFKALVKDGNCRAEWTNIDTIEVTNQTAPPPPDVDSVQYACIGTDYTIQPSVGNYQWYEQAIGGWPIGGNNPVNSVTVKITDAWITRYVSEVDNSTNCVSNRVEVQVRPNLEPGEIYSGEQRECDLHKPATTIGSDQDAVAYDGTVDYQWYVQVNGDTTWQKIDTATSATFTPQAYMGREGEYIFIRKAKNSNCDSLQQSRGKWRLVVGKPNASIVAVPGHATICQNGGIKLHLRVPASTTYSYQWYKDGDSIQGATGHEYIATAVGTYKARVTHKASGCSATTPDTGAIRVKYDDDAPTATSVDTTLNGCSIADAQAVTAYDSVRKANDSGLGFNIYDSITPVDSLKLTYTEAETETEDLPDGVCYQLVRTYTVTDQCGFDTTFTHTINVKDTEAPSIEAIEVPAAVPAGSCKYKIPDLSAATLAVSSDNCRDVSFVEQTPAAGFEYSQTNTEYTVTVVVKVKDACNNETIQEVQITIPAIPTISAAGSALDCYGDSDGNISYTITGGHANYTVVLSLAGTDSKTATHTTAGDYSMSGLASGTYTVTVTDANGCTATASATVSEPSALTVTLNPENETCAGDDGKINYTIAGGTAGTAGYTVVLSGGSANQTVNQAEADTYTFTDLEVGTYTVTVTDGNNCVATATTTITIEQINTPLTITAQSHTWDYDGQSHTRLYYDVIFGSEQHSIASGSSVTLSTGDVVTATVFGSITNAGTEDNTVTRVTVTRGGTDVTCYYDIDEVAGTLKINPIDVVVTIVGANNTTAYDGEEHTVTGYTATANTSLYDVDEDFTFTPAAGANLVDGVIAASRTDVGTTNMGLAANQFTNTNGNFATVTFNVTDGYQTIEPIDVVVTIVGANNTTDYDGEVHTVTGYDVTISDPLYTEDDFTFSGTASASRTEAGTTNMGLAAEQFENTNGNFATVTFNVTDGWQKITPIDVVVNITGHTNTAAYDGAEHTVTGYTATTESTLYDVESDFTFSGTASASRTEAGTTNMGLAAEQFENTNGNFATVTFNVTDGWQKIEPRPVTLTSATDSKIYDGTPLTNSTVTVGGDGFVTGEGATYDVTGTITNVGSCFNTFTYTLNSNTDANNYTITKIEGTLTILIDSVPPCIGCDPIAGVSCETIGNQTRTNDENQNYYTHSGTAWDVNATDNSGAIPVMTWSLTGVTTASGNSTLNGQRFNVGVTTVTWTATDVTGNPATCQFTVTVTDDENPVISCPSDIAGIACITDVPAAYTDYAAFQTAGGEATDNDVVDYESFALVDADTNGTCPTTITRTYYIEDTTGNSATCTQVITIKDSIAPALAGTWPINITGQDNCLANRNISGLKSDDAIKALYSDCNTFTVIHKDTVTGNNCGWTVTRTYTITDLCGNTVMPKPTMSVSGRDQTEPYIMPTVLDRTLTATGCEFRIPDMREEVRAISSDGCTGNSALTVEQPSAGMQVYPQVIARDTNVIIRVTDSCGNYSLKSVKITIPAKVVITATATPASICNGETAQLSTTVTNVVGAASYVWEPSTGLNSTTIYNPTTTLTATGASDTVTYTVKVTDANGCTATATTFVTVNPKVVMDTVADQAICHGSEMAAVNFTTPITDGSVVYNWSRDNNSIGGLAMSGIGNIAAATLTNTTNTAQTTTITVTPVYANNGKTCTDETITFTITVYPKVVMDTVANQAICHGSAITAVNFSSDLSGGDITYTWRRTNSNIGGLDMSDTGNIPATVLTNTTNTVQVDTITVTPVYTNNGNECTDETITFTITVNPKVVMNDVADQAICHGSAITEVNFSSDLIGGDITYTWRRTNSNVVGLDMSGTGNIPTTVLTNTTHTAQVDTIYVKPTYEANSNVCDDDSVFFTITVNPEVVMNDVADQAICHGSEMAAVNFTTPITDGSVVYNWSRNNDNIGGLDMSGTGNIPDTVLTNTTNTAQVDTITVTPVYTNNGNECTDESITFTITVNPKVVMNDVVDQAICHGSAITAVNFTTPITDGSVVYNWSRDNDSISGLAMSGIGNIPATVLTNTTNTAQVDTITVTPVYTNNGNECTDESITFTITVNPKVVMNDVVDQAICHGSEMAAVNFTTPITDGSVVYNWSRNNENIEGLEMSGTGNIAAATLTNTTNTAQTTTITVIPVYTNNGNECTDDSITFTITVNPKVVMNTVADWTLCVGETSPEYVYTSTITDGTVTYGWSNDNSAIGLAASGTGNLPSFVAANATTANLIAEVKVAPTYANNGISCQGDSINFHITVRPSIKTPGNVAFTCPADTTVVLSYSECEQFVNIGYPEFVNNMTGMDVVITNDAPTDSIFPEGTTIVTWTATDECGAFLTCTQNVVIQFPSCGDSIADFDGYRYSSVRIGCQCWTGENARSEHYSDGTPVDNFRYYNDSDSLESVYGKLYSWYTAVRVPEGDDTAVPADSIDPLGNSYVQGICPEGWALPTVDEYMLMIANSGDATHAKDGSNLYWLPGYEGQPPFSGFDAYGAGKYNGAIDRYQDLLGKTYFWTTLSGSGSETATTVEINYYCAEGLQTELSKGDGVSIRCIRKR